MIGPAPQVLLQHSVSGRDEMADSMSRTVSRPIPLVSVVIELLDRAAEAVDNDSAAAKHYIARASALLQKDHSRAIGESSGSMTRRARGGLAPWQMRQVAKHIEAALASPIGTQDCATIARLSVSQFRRAFKVSFGVTFHRYIYQRRVERAQKMMMMTDQPVCQIARRCGFADQSHFARVFRRLVGPSLADWRRL